MMKQCQYCSNQAENFRMILSVFNVGGVDVSRFVADRPTGITSVFRHHPVVVCSYHYDHLPRHVRHCRTERGAWP